METRMAYVLLSIVGALASAGPSQAATLVGIDIDQDSNHPVNWTLQHRYLPPLHLSNLVAENGFASPLDLTLDGSPGDDFPISVIASTLPIHTQSLSGIDGGMEVASGVGPDVVTARWSNLIPLATYEVYVFSLADVPPELNVPVVLVVNAQVGDSSRTINSYAEFVQANSSGEIGFGMPGPLFPEGNELAGLAIRGALIPGDFDANNVVDGSDFLAWQRGESPTPWSQADLALWETHYGSSWPVITSVPEPATWIAVVLWLIAMICHYRVVGVSLNRRDKQGRTSLPVH